MCEILDSKKQKLWLIKTNKKVKGRGERENLWRKTGHLPK